MSQETLHIKQFTKFCHAATPPFFKVSLPGGHYYILPAPPKARTSVSDLQECMLALLLYKWPKKHHLGGPWLRSCSWQGWGHMYPCYMQIWACPYWGPRVILDQPMLDFDGIPLWVMDLYFIKCAHLALWNHAGLSLVNSSLRLQAAQHKAAEIYNWIDLSQFIKFNLQWRLLRGLSQGRGSGSSTALSCHS